MSTPTRRSHLIIFLVIFALALSWAFYTRHAWEDYYITYRASKNLATGRGLTFTAGERVHSFTSPLGVLLPALASVLTGNKSDGAALWIFRLLSITALSGAGVLLWKIAGALFSRRIAALLLVLSFALDAKIVDFSTNGMETAFVLLFLAWTLWALLTSPPRTQVHLGLAWAGLMWARPDSFIYIAALAAGTWLFLPAGAPPGSRRKIFRSYLQGGVITTALYLPWLLWAWSYYGSPLPHTIVAKGLFQPPTTLQSLGRALFSFPSQIATHRDILTTTFMPPYSFNTGWPALALSVSFWVSLAVMLIWVLPWIRREARVASFAFFIGQFYLTNYVGFPVPWYLPTLTLFALVVLASLTDQAAAWSHHELRSIFVRRIAFISGTLALAAAGTLLAGEIALFGMAAYQLRWQQQLIELGQRREIGLWLKHQAKTERETVFLEPLGYIGFYSNLKMLDFPGLSSPEVIAARRRIGSRSYPDCWPELILELLPNWIVARSYEVEALRKTSPEVFDRFYQLARTFDVRAQIEAVPHLPGRGYLLNDALFQVYRRTDLVSQKNATVVSLATLNSRKAELNEAWGHPAYDDGPTIHAHAPSRLVFRVPPGAQSLSGGLGIFEGAYADPQNSTDGADFSVTGITPDGKRRELFRRALRPRDVTADRGVQRFSVEFPADTLASVELAISPGPAGSNGYDWSYWSLLYFEIPRTR